MFAEMSSRYSWLDDRVSSAVFEALDAVGLKLRPGFEPLQHLPFVSSPTPLIIAIVGYLAVVVLSLLNGK